MQSAKMASVLHKEWTGRGLKITEEAVVRGKEYVEEDGFEEGKEIPWLFARE